MALTHTESKLSEIIKKTIDPSLHAHLQNISLSCIQKEDRTKIMVLQVPKELLIPIHQAHKEINQNARKEYPDYFLYIIRKKHDEKTLIEDWVKDLAFPALVQGRKTQIMPGRILEEAIIERKIFIDEHELTNREFIFRNLTDKEIKFSMRYY